MGRCPSITNSSFRHLSRSARPGLQALQERRPAPRSIGSPLQTIPEDKVVEIETSPSAGPRVVILSSPPEPGVLITGGNPRTMTSNEFRLILDPVSDKIKEFPTETFTATVRRLIDSEGLQKKQCLLNNITDKQKLLDLNDTKKVKDDLKKELKRLTKKFNRHNFKTNMLNNEKLANLADFLIKKN